LRTRCQGVLVREQGAAELGGFEAWQAFKPAREMARQHRSVSTSTMTREAIERHCPKKMGEASMKYCQNQTYKYKILDGRVETRFLSRYCLLCLFMKAFSVLVR
jgi:hypothetical protein